MDEPSGKAERIESHSVDAVMAQQQEQEPKAEPEKLKKQHRPRTKKVAEEAQVLALA